MENIWDKKAETYAKFDTNLNEFGQNLFKFIEDEGINFAGKSVIDIGAGTGVYSLYIATLGAKLYALDSSVAMLGELKISAQKHGINVEQIINDDFASFTQKNELKFDIAFLSMSPALRTKQDFDMFLNLAKRKIYVNWASERNSSMLAPIFAHFGIKKSSLNLTTQNFELNLKNKNIPYKSREISERRIQRRNLGEAVQNALWHLGVNGANISEKALENLLEKQVKNGIITDEINATFKAFII
ncbi:MULTISPECIES: class I SAM-dependent methyltransferase [unclassified Campylobacter]|uniref:class I SAM-dependent methyltransferase n=1 Tax=unclassified Campylobacter TaxID=2593542 RepID=UPI0022E9B0BE|nr:MULTISPECIES: class I SAM-dependent methyltransferase [unclassified Campylobacter]MDA3054747.1 class I SAM-dependent methyltransferase [Campylobacter sp. VBCF_07 NA4]MDA3061220.1 class I SAM-dependent methyltransferase [Campylobacter sp. VBCF_02 NA5]MDA3070696.1 class I SAM-dependent methyltransferase [Campylobacter sp. VBCF_08 NA3]WBR54202.1 class I SAM-dependent methyltransferase [Campylobacter sp. VBCF_01 NA2]